MQKFTAINVGQNKDKSYTDEVVFKKNNRFFVKSEFGEEDIRPLNDYIFTPANNFVFESGREHINATNLFNANEVYKKTSKGYVKSKKRMAYIERIDGNKNDSFVNQKVIIVAENKTHIQFIYDFVAFIDFVIVRKDEYKKFS